MLSKENAFLLTKLYKSNFAHIGPTQNLANIASQISQLQLNPLVTKFGGDPNFQVLLFTGSIPVTALQTNKALLSSSPAQQTIDPIQHPELYLIGLQLT
jgi:hypothetical protein